MNGPLKYDSTAIIVTVMKFNPYVKSAPDMKVDSQSRDSKFLKINEYFMRGFLPFSIPPSLIHPQTWSHLAYLVNGIWAYQNEVEFPMFD